MGSRGVSAVSVSPPASRYDSRARWPVFRGGGAQRGARQLVPGALLVLALVAVVVAVVKTGAYPSAAIGRLLPSTQAESGRVVTRYPTQALGVGWSADGARVI